MSAKGPRRVLWALRTELVSLVLRGPQVVRVAERELTKFPPNFSLCRIRPWADTDK